MGVEIQIDDRELQELARMVEKFGNADLGQLGATLGAIGESQTRRRLLHEKTAPDGQPWAPWSDAYEQTRHGGHSLLMGEGDLEDSIRWFPFAGGVGWGSDLRYAALHQAGGEPVGIDVEARPYLGISDENWDEIIEVAADWLESSFDGAVH